ncbi:MAG: hypothetical protein ABR963_03820 [Acidimicrobiales bacterium]
MKTEDFVHRYRASRAVVIIRRVGGVLLGVSGVWVIVAGELYRRRVLDWLGLALVVLGVYLFILARRARHP